MKPKVPNTITDKQYTDLQRRAVKANPSMITDEAIKRRQASNAQRTKANQS